MINTVINKQPFKAKDNKYYYIYKIINNINRHFYIGVHTSKNVPDSYIGSGSRLHDAYKKYGVNNFTKYIFEFFTSQKDMLNAERLIVNEVLVDDPNCYNITVGGGIIPSQNKTVVKDMDGNTLQVSCDDPLMNKKYFPINTNMVAVVDKNGNMFQVSVDDPRFISGELVGICKGFIITKDKNGNIFRVKVDDPRLKTGELIHIVKNTVSVEDNHGNKFRVSTNDPRLKTGELKYHTTGRITVVDKFKNTLSVSVNDPRLKTGELVSVNKSRIYITNGELNKMIYKSDLPNYINNGWKIGVTKKGNIIVHKDNMRKLIYEHELHTYINDGWIRGQGKTRPKSGRPRKIK